MVRLCPAGRSPRLQGNPLPQAPALGTKPSPGGVGSSTTTLVAVDGPSFVTSIVKATLVPAVAMAGPDFVTTRSAAPTIVDVSELVSLADAGSVVSAGGATVAVLVSVPVASGDTVPVAVKVTEPPAGRSTVVVMLPDPLVAAQLDPGAGLQVQVTLPGTRGKVSVTAAPVTSLGPALVTVMVYVSARPARTSSRPSVLVTERSATSAGVADTLALSFGGLGSGGSLAGRLAVFVRPPVGVTGAVRESAADWVAARLPTVHAPLAGS